MTPKMIAIMIRKIEIVADKSRIDVCTGCLNGYFYVGVISCQINDHPVTCKGYRPFDPEEVETFKKTAEQCNIFNACSGKGRELSRFPYDEIIKINHKCHNECPKIT